MFNNSDMSGGRSYSAQDFFGALLLIGALFALGLFNFKSDEPLVEAGIRAQADAITATSVHAMQAQLDGRNITLTGLADTEDEKTRIMEALRAIEGRAKLRADVTVLEPLDPFTFTARKQPGAPLVLSGGIPTEPLRARLKRDYGDGADALPLASGAPDENWPDLLQTALRALDQLDQGKLTFEGRTLRLEGAALTPDVQDRALLLLEDLPPDYQFTPDITVLDDGTPLRLTAARRDRAAPSLSGKLPPELIDTLPEGDFTASPLPLPFADWGQGLTKGLEALEQLQSGHLAVIGPSLTLTGEAWSQAAYDTALAILDSLPAQMQLSSDIKLADTGAPFALHITLDDGAATATGKVPRSLAPPVLRALIGVPLQATALEIARVSPGEDWWTAASMGVEALRGSQQGTLDFDGTALSLSARVADPPAADAFTASLENLPDGITLTLALDLIDDGTPLRLSLRFDGAGGTLWGKLPDTLTPATLSKPLGVPVTPGDLITTPNPAPAGWSQAAETGAQALALLTKGTLSLSEDQLLLSGTARDPAGEAEVLKVLADVPPGYTATTELTFQDDGRPFAFRLEFDGARAVLSGKTPSDLGPASQSAILGFPVTTDALVFAGVPADTDWWIAARAGLKALSGLQHGVLTLDAYHMALSGQAADDKARQAALRQLAPLQDTFNITTRIATP